MNSPIPMTVRAASTAAGLETRVTRLCGELLVALCCVVAVAVIATVTALPMLLALYGHWMEQLPAMHLSWLSVAWIAG